MLSTGQLSRFIAMAITATPKRTVVAQVEQRVKDGKCLLCEAAAEKRGLC